MRQRTTYHGDGVPGARRSRRGTAPWTIGDLAEQLDLQLRLLDDWTPPGPGHASRPARPYLVKRGW